MYEYSPKTNKKTEKTVFFGFLGLATLFYVGSLIPNMLFPAVFQLIAFALLAVAIIVVSKFMLCRYIYCVEKREDDSLLGEGYDFVIVERIGRRSTTVCRFGTDKIVSLTRVTKENKKSLADEHRGKNVYRYTAEMRADNVYLLVAEQYGQTAYVYILADAVLEKILFRS